MVKSKWKLISKDTKKEIEFGETLTSFREEKYAFIGGSPPHKPSSTGTVFVVENGQGMSYYPSVFNCKWEKRDE